jgi:xanthine dehydrogenase accessory factor
MAIGDDPKLLNALTDALAAGTPVVLATVVATKRSVPRHAGTKMLVYGDGSLLGTVGGGAMESRVIDEALVALRTGTAKLLQYELLAPDRGDPGVCGGEVQIYLEPYMPPHTVLVVGAGHVGRAVVDLAHWLGYRTVVTDDREDRLSDSTMPNADVMLSGSIGDVLGEYEVTADTSIVIVSRDVDIDVAAITAVADSPAGYLGVMGSTRRWKMVRNLLIENGLDEEVLDRVQVPIGSELGAETVEEIAVSIMSEVIRSVRSDAG